MLDSNYLITCCFHVILFILIHLMNGYHLQELTKLRITDIQGIEKPQVVLTEKPSKPSKKEQEKVAVSV